MDGLVLGTSAQVQLAFFVSTILLYVRQVFMHHLSRCTLTKGPITMKN